MVYSLVSSFAKVFVFLLAVFTAYRINEIAAPILTAWVTVPFVCLAILGAKYVGEVADKILRRKLGYAVDGLDD